MKYLNIYFPLEAHCGGLNKNCHHMLTFWVCCLQLFELFQERLWNMACIKGCVTGVWPSRIQRLIPSQFVVSLYFVLVEQNVSSWLLLQHHWCYVSYHDGHGLLTPCLKLNIFFSKILWSWYHIKAIEM